ncbi:MAG: hypothetical protein R3B06_01380 [Kofleriaceae bacterium]
MAVAGLGCGDRRPPLAPPGSTAGATGPEPVDGGPDAGPGAEPAAAPRLAPHAGAIAAVVLDHDATAALSNDLRGGVRLWPTLDGTREPAVVPATGAVALDLARTGDGFVVGAIDASGAPHLYRLDARGGLRGSTDIPAVPQGVGLVALGADAWLLVRADQSIELYDRGGRRRAVTARDGTRVAAVRAEAADRAVIIISQRSGTTAAAAAITLTVAGDELTWGTPVPLPIAPDAPVELALSPDGKRLAYLSTPALVAAAAGGPAAVRPAGGLELRLFEAAPVPQLPPGVVVVVDRATGADVTPAALRALQLNGARRLGFTDAATLMACATDGNAWSSGLAADATPTTPALPFQALPAIGPGLVVAPLGGQLQVVDGAGAQRHLGYQVLRPVDASLAPAGDRLAVVDPRGRIVIGAVDGGGPTVVAQVDDAVAAVFVDDDAVVAMTDSELVLVGARDGAVRGRATVPASVPPLRWNPRTRRLAGHQRSKGQWATRLTGAGFAPVRTLNDGAIAGWLVDADDDDAPAMVASDGATRWVYRGRDLDTPLTRAALKAITRRPLPGSFRDVTSSGAEVRYDGELRWYPTLDAADGVDLGAAEPMRVAAAPGTGRLLVVDTDGVAQAFEADGRVAWALMLGVQARALTASADGRRAAVVTEAGVVVVEVATGAVLARRCGWDFGLWPDLPADSTLDGPSVCE